jgi:hypothetical protein
MIEWCVPGKSLVAVEKNGSQYEIRRAFLVLPLLLILCVPRHRFSVLALLPHS